MNSDTLLHRQINPSWVQNDVVSSQAFINEKSIASLAFNPSDKDKNKLSVYNGDKYTAEESYMHFTESLSSAGVLSVTVEEVSSLPDLFAYEDNNPFNGHSIIDYTKVPTKTQVEKRARKLKGIAIARGWTYKKT